ncbi:hypothetical protein [Sphingopyxis terrae]|uniref:hypothetical protein n=1 Tax=Sphingopyxis terrae TaxID=33052 RepID=UPI003F7E522D
MANEGIEQVRAALEDIYEPPIDDDAGDDQGGGFGPPRVMPDDCPVVPVGTHDGIFYFLTTLGELRGLAADKVANKHIVAMFAPDSQYLIDTWPRKKEVKRLDKETGEEITEWIVTGWRPDDVAMLLMDVAAAKGVWDMREKVRGRGAWLGDDGALILHSGNHVLIDGAWKRPGEYHGMVYPTAPPGPKPAGNGVAGVPAVDLAPKLVASLRARGIEIADDVGAGPLIFELIRTWNWARPDIDPHLLVGWIMCAPFGGAFDYRPLVWITGDKATGKSALQKLLAYLLGDGGLLQSPDATEAGVRQVLGQQSLPVAIDEAEADANNSKILALVRLARLAASSQGDLLRGGQDHKGHNFKARTCFLFTSILVPPIPPQDKSRLAVLELGELPGELREPDMDKREIAALGAQLRREFVDLWRWWPRILASYKNTLIDNGGHGGRVADQFGTLLAAAHMVLNAENADAGEIFAWGDRLSITTLAEAADNESEAVLCVRHLMSTLVNLQGHGTPRLVSSWLWQAAQPVPDYMMAGTAAADEVHDLKRAANKMLEKIGMKVIVAGAAKPGVGDDGRPKPVPGRQYVAIASKHQGLARQFEGERWAAGVWSQALKRLPGALANQTQRIGNAPAKCTLVPVDVLELGADDDPLVEEATAEMERV